MKGHATSLRRILLAACATASTSLAAQGCCCIGREFGPTHPQSLVPLDARVVAGQKVSPDGELSIEFCRTVCTGAVVEGCHLATLGAVVKDGEPDPKAPLLGSPFVHCHGYRPGGCHLSFGHGRDTRARQSAIGRALSVGAYFAGAAQLERTSVVAFAEMVRELRDLGAPSSLVRSARRARKDEARHARAMARLARAHGASVEAVRFVKGRKRALSSVASENAVEGCVRELLGAALVLHQSQTSTDEGLRRVFASIARDETRHAALALRTFRWTREALTEPGRARVRSAMERAVASLYRDPPCAERACVGADVGLPDAATARALVSALDTAIWSPLAATLRS